MMFSTGIGYCFILAVIICLTLLELAESEEKMSSQSWPFVVKIGKKESHKKAGGEHGKEHGHHGKGNHSAGNCAGTLISDKYVLTAADCVKGKASDYAVELTSGKGKPLKVSKVIIEKEFGTLALLKLSKGASHFKDYASLFLSSCKLRSEKCMILALDEKDSKHMEQVPFTIELCQDHVKQKDNNAVFANVCSENGDAHCDKHPMGSPLFCPVGKGYSQFGVLHSSKCQFGMVRYYSLWILNTLETHK